MFKDSYSAPSAYPQITQMTADERKPSVVICDICGFLERTVFLLALFAIIVSACGGSEATPAARFATGSYVRLKADTASLILFTECGSPFGRLAGVANSGDEAVILERDHCNGDWWYRVQIEALKNEDWQGMGWVLEDSLKVK